MLPCHARCVFSHLRCNVASLLSNCYLRRIGGIENIHMAISYLPYQLYLYHANYHCAISVLCLLCLYYVHYADYICSMPVGLLCLRCLFITKTGLKTCITSKFTIYFPFKFTQLLRSSLIDVFSSSNLEIFIFRVLQKFRDHRVRRSTQNVRGFDMFLTAI